MKLFIIILKLVAARACVVYSDCSQIGSDGRIASSPSPFPHITKRSGRNWAVTVLCSPAICCCTENTKHPRDIYCRNTLQQKQDNMFWHKKTDWSLMWTFETRAEQTYEAYLLPLLLLCFPTEDMLQKDVHFGHGCCQIMWSTTYSHFMVTFCRNTTTLIHPAFC